MTLPSLNAYPGTATEVFLILHEHAHRPQGCEYEYMTGQLRQNLDQNAFGRVLTFEGEERAREVGRRLKGVGLSFIVTESFSVTLETARLVSEESRDNGSVPIMKDARIRESDLSYLSKKRFQELGEAEEHSNPNATIGDWMRRCPTDFEHLVAGHVELWNELLSAHSGERFAFVLHVEGFLLYTVLLLGLEPQMIGSLHIPRAHPIHVRLYQKQNAVISFGDESYWKTRPVTIFGQYS